MLNPRPFPLRGMLCLVLGFALTACSSGLKREPSTETNRSKKLEPVEDSIFSTARLNRPKILALPPDLVSSEALQESIAEAKADAKTDLPVLPEVTQARVVEADGRRWLEVSADAQEVWDVLVQFWADNRVELVEFDPTVGLMQTDWIDVGDVTRRDEGGPAGMLRYLFGRVTAANTHYDRYRLRLERASADVTQVYVSHEATRRVVKEGTRARVSEFNWVSEDENPETVARLLQTLRQLFRE